MGSNMNIKLTSLADPVLSSSSKLATILSFERISSFDFLNV